MKDIIAYARAWIENFAEGDFSTFPGEVAEDFTLRLPFVPPGVPSEIKGRETVSELLKKTSRSRSKLVFRDLTIRKTDDPELVVSTCRGEATMANGKTYRNSYVMFTRIRDGKVLEHTEYLNPLAVMAAADDPD